MRKDISDPKIESIIIDWTIVFVDLPIAATQPLGVSEWLRVAQSGWGLEWLRALCESVFFHVQGSKVKFRRGTLTLEFFQKGTPWRLRFQIPGGALFIKNRPNNSKQKSSRPYGWQSKLGDIGLAIWGGGAERPKLITLFPENPKSLELSNKTNKTQNCRPDSWALQA